MPKRLTVEDVMDILQKRIDRMEAKMEREGGNLLVTDMDEFLPKVEAYEEVIELLSRVRV